MAGWRFELALVVEKKRENAIRVLFIGILCVIGSSVLYALGISALAWRGLLFSGATLPFSGLWTLLWIGVISMNSMAISWLLRSGEIRSIAIAQILTTIAGHAVYIWGGYLQGGGLPWLIAGSIFGSLCGFLYCVRMMGREVVRGLFKVKINTGLLAIVKKHRSFMQYSLGAGLLSSVRERLTLVVLGYFVSPVEIGLYSQARRLSLAPANLCASILRPVYFNLASRFGLLKIGPSLEKTTTMLVCLGVPLLVTAGMRAEPMCAWFLGEKWRAVGPFLILLVLPGLTDALSSWLDRLLDVARRQYLNLILEAFAGFGSLFTLVLILMKSGDFYFALGAQSVLVSLIGTGYLFLVFHYTGLGIGRVLRLLLLGGFVGGLAFILNQLIWTVG